MDSAASPEGHATQPQDKVPKRGWAARIWGPLGVIQPEISPQVSAVLTEIAWSPEPVKRLAKFMNARFKVETRYLKQITFLVPIMIILLGVFIYGLVTNNSILVSDRWQWTYLVAFSFNFVAAVVILRRHAFDHEMLRARLLWHLLQALSASIKLEKDPQDAKVRGRLAGDLEAASARFNSVYRRLPGHRVRIYAEQLEAKALAGAQAIASMASLLFDGAGALPDLRDRLARAILRIEAEDWLSVAQLGVGGDVPKRRRSSGLFLEPSTVPLIVGALTVTTAVLSLVAKLLETLFG